MTSADAMCCHMQLCQSAPACGNDDHDDCEEESDTENKEDDDFTFT